MLLSSSVANDDILLFDAKRVKDKCLKLEDTHGMVVKKFPSLERSLYKNPVYNTQYQEFLCEYKRIDLISEVVFITSHTIQ